MKVLVCGGRDYWDWEAVYGALDALPVKVVVEGGASGADKLAQDWARSRLIPVKTVPADWKAHGRSAGPVRNQRMIDEEKPDLVLAFPGGRGTADMVRRAKEAGIEVRKPR